MESYQHDKQHAFAAIEKQIAMDIDKLPVPNRELHITGKPSEVDDYIHSFNQSLAQKEFPITLEQITPDPIDNESDFIIRSIRAQGQTIAIVMSDSPIPLANLLSVFPFLATVLISFLFFELQKSSEQQVEEVEESEEETISAWLQVDLKQKKLINMTNQNSVDMANKPLCFFSALIDYCQQNPEQHINPNKDLPDELISLSNKYFFRLIDLGHTIRKRPNFTNNLEKTLSEIRAGLDEIFEKDFEKKEIFYPPKAIGEGSRSKAHSFALDKLDVQRLEFVGK